jgi:glycosyltransferase involved in cell wall biosynthesis
MVRVVFATTVFEGVETGPGTYARYLWQVFKHDKEVEFHVVAPTLNERDPRLHVAGVRSIRSAATYRSVARAAVDIASKLGRGTIIHGNTAHGMGYAMNYGGPVMVQINDYEAAQALRHAHHALRRSGVHRWLSLLWRHRQEALVIPKAARVVCNSEFTRREVIRAYGDRHAHSIVTVHKGVDLTTFFAKVALTGDEVNSALTGSSRLLYVGTNWRIKGLRDLIAALPEIATAFPDVSLTVVGPSQDECLAEIAHLAKQAGCHGRINLVGRIQREDFPSLYRACDLLVHPAYSEALGVAVLEALASGLPVVAYATGGIPEIVNSDEVGALVRPGSVEGLAAAVKGILSSPERRQILTANGRERAKEFSLDVMVANVRGLYRSLADR